MPAPQASPLVTSYRINYLQIQHYPVTVGAGGGGTDAPM